ncbi:hypothetical protein KSB_46580 [Ktedonobacter robiniae]|uniref:Uncharacterized protein n=1 Tax=Ktedonobacter robiniae TaxID=2778365 RepID=A0ABQ3UU12_9CHLR|nr:hypothetical protein KSB_46580 [Ktedonobacter robiniae]
MDVTNGLARICEFLSNVGNDVSQLLPALSVAEHAGNTPGIYLGLLREDRAV